MPKPRLLAASFAAVALATLPITPAHAADSDNPAGLLTLYNQSATWVDNTLTVKYTITPLFGPVYGGGQTDLYVDGVRVAGDSELLNEENNYIAYTGTRAGSRGAAVIEVRNSACQWTYDDDLGAVPPKTCGTETAWTTTVRQKLTTAPKPPTPPSSSSKSISAKKLLGKLTVRAEDHKHRYVRSRFHYGMDADGDGCNTRKEVLIAEHRGSIRVSSSCAVYSTWKSLFDNRTVTQASGLEVDHLVALAEAWHSGAYKWSAKKLRAYGNDLGYKWSLNAVTTASNQKKGARDPAEWLPAKNKCTYVKAWIAVKYRWHLTIDSREKAALRRGLNNHCDSLSIAQPGVPSLNALT